MCQGSPIAGRVCLLTARSREVQRCLEVQPDQGHCVPSVKTLHHGDSQEAATARQMAGTPRHSEGGRPIGHAHPAPHRGGVQSHRGGRPRCDTEAGTPLACLVIRGSRAATWMWGWATEHRLGDDSAAGLGAGRSCVSADPGDKCAHLAGFGVHIPAAEEFLYDAHVLLGFHRGQGCQHDGGVARFVLVIHVTHVCKDTSLVREKPSTATLLPRDQRNRVGRRPLNRPPVLQVTL